MHLRFESDGWVWMQIETSLAAATTSPGAVAGRPAPTLLIQQALEAIARISKGFNANLCTRVRPEIGQRLLPKLTYAWLQTQHSILAFRTAAALLNCKRLPSVDLDVCMALGSTQQLRFQEQQLNIR